ncbi:uncharacterized protein LOC111435340 isoform X2 [Cucurbita moschata]|uniref:Uncharacterized protein LOC111435340 isoform X2 n=1 Tax=Cucurbita moschata TaxID=3662 RepID=A0A6J1ES15_CUCMO|nr:uncharacterized protein LOC111435340 isoform X2 [Cucurbita moschata]
MEPMMSSLCSLELTLRQRRDLTLLFLELTLFSFIMITRTAYDVSLNDASWPGDVFDVISGETSKSWERLDAGGHLSHSFELEAKTKGMFHGSPAVVTFRVPTKSALQEALSTPILPLDVLADRLPENKFEWVKRLLAKYGSLISVNSIVILFIYLVASPSKSSAKGSKKKR